MVYSNKIASVSEFSQGRSGKIFNDVYDNNVEYLVLKNNAPVAVIVPVGEYDATMKRIKELEDNQLLMDIYKEFGLYKEKLVSLTKKGISGTEEIKAMMERFRNTPPTDIEGEKVHRQGITILPSWSITPHFSVVSCTIKSWPLYILLTFFHWQGVTTAPVFLSIKPSTIAVTDSGSPTPTATRV